MRNRRVKSVLIVLLVILFLFGSGLLFGRWLATVVEAQPDEAFEAAACPFEAALTVECGFVTVPARHAEPDGETIRLAVVVSQGDESLAPVIVLSGGPGEITTPTAGGVAPIFQNIVNGRTLIMFDQRGVGRSEPALACPEWTESTLAQFQGDPAPADALRRNYESLVACSERLTAEGIDLGAYNSVENAADVAAIIRALGYDQADIFGVSYGSLLAQHVMRDHPEVVRSVVIDSVLPIGTSFSIGTVDTATAAVDRLLAACEAQPACAEAYPDLRGTLFDAIEFYNENPVPITVENPVTGESYDTFLYGDSILTSVFVFLYRTAVIPTLPEAIVAIAEGDTSIAASLQSQFIPALYALERGMQYSVFCAEDVVGVTEMDLLARYEALPPQYRGRADLEDLMEYSTFDVCAQWPVEPLAAEFMQPVVSDLPVLAVAGEFDPVTPPGYAEQVVANLPNAFSYTFPGVGHSVALADACPVSIIQQFLDDPMTEPDAGCIDAMGVVFRVPGAGLALEPFTDETMAITGVIPEGWQALGPGVYAESGMGSVVILQQSAPVSAEELRTLLAGQFGIEAFPESRTTREANGLTWSIYETTGPQGLLADVAIAEGEGVVYGIILLSTPLDRPTYYDGLFLPAIDALTPLS